MNMPLVEAKSSPKANLEASLIWKLFGVVESQFQYSWATLCPAADRAYRADDLRAGGTNSDASNARGSVGNRESHYLASNDGDVNPDRGAR